MKPTVFISYNHRDKGIAQRAKAKLEANGFPVIIDAEAMKVGEDIKSFIEACIRKSDVTLSLVSENSLLSAWVAMESINSFYDEKVRGQRFMPVALSGAFFARDFVDRALERVEVELEAIKELIMGRLDKGLGFEDLQNERTRYNQLKANLPEIVRRLRESLTVDISGDNFDAGMDKVLVGLGGAAPATAPEGKKDLEAEVAGALDDFTRQRLESLKKKLAQQQELLARYEEELSLETDPRRQMRHEREINNTRQAIERTLGEIHSMKVPI